MLVKLDHLPNFRGENKTCLSCHHPDLFGSPFSISYDPHKMYLTEPEGFADSDQGVDVFPCTPSLSFNETAGWFQKVILLCNGDGKQRNSSIHQLETIRSLISTDESPVDKSISQIVLAFFPVALYERRFLFTMSTAQLVDPYLKILFKMSYRFRFKCVGLHSKGPYPYFK